MTNGLHKGPLPGGGYTLPTPTRTNRNEDATLIDERRMSNRRFREGAWAVTLFAIWSCNFVSGGGQSGVARPEGCRQCHVNFHFPGCPSLLQRPTYALNINRYGGGSEGEERGEVMQCAAGLSSLWCQTVLKVFKDCSATHSR
uniref:Uncharacterized protein n=1 Tax=Knipowitschia caucasica TaxID=637954 RepID=A0AAV2JRQ2_KNICA